MPASTVIFLEKCEPSGAIARRLRAVALSFAPFAMLALLGVRPSPGAPAGDPPPVPDLRPVFPVPGATAVCPDAPLRLAFAGPPTLGSTGGIRVVDAESGAVVESIDMGSPSPVETVGGLEGFHYHPVIVDGAAALVCLRAHALSYHKTYYVNADPGVFRVGDSPCAGISTPGAWRFSTRTAPPAAGAARLTVAADGSGDFCTVQGALDFIPEGNNAPVTVFLRKGTYTELVCLLGRNAVTILGEDRRETVIAYANNLKFNPGSSNPYANGSNPLGAGQARGGIYRRGVFLAHRAAGLVLANLTIRNTTPRGGSQAEAVILNGTPTARAILKEVDLYSFQDTLQINGQAFVTGCAIEGDVDFMWGTGPCFFEDCVCRSVRSDAFYTQIRNPGTNHGYVYVRCTFDGIPGVTGNFLSRIAASRFPHSEVVLVDCVLGPSVGSAGWRLDRGPNGELGDASGVHFWECRSRDAGGKPVDVSGRLGVSRQLREPEDAAMIADYGNATFVLGDNWNPRLAPIFSR